MRGSNVLVAILAGTLGGVGGGFSVGWLRPPAPPKRPASGSAAVSADVQELTQRVAALETEVTTLRRQRPGAAPAQPAAPAASGAPRAADLVDDPVFEAAVRSVVERVQQDRAEDRRAQGTQRWADRLADELKLTEAQKASALALAQELNDRVRALREDAGAGDVSHFVQKRDSLRDHSEQRLAEILSPSQMTQYRAAPELRLLGPRGGRGRGDP